MVSEILPDVSIGVQSLKLPYYLHRDNLTVGKTGSKPPFPNGMTLSNLFEEVIHAAENGNNKP